MRFQDILISRSQKEWLSDRGMVIEQHDGLFRLLSSTKETIESNLDEVSLVETIMSMIESSANLYEMANLDSETTGLPMYIFCSPKGNAKHECRIKVCNTNGKMNEDDTFSIDVHSFEIHGECRLNIDDLERVKWWIHYNKFPLLDYWKNRINTKTFLNSVKNILNVNVSQSLKKTDKRR